MVGCYCLLFFFFPQCKSVDFSLFFCWVIMIGAYIFGVVWWCIRTLVFLIAKPVVGT